MLIKYFRGPRERCLVWAIASAALACAFGIWFLLKPVPLDIQAKQIIEGVRRDDSSLLLNHLLDYEIRKYGLDRAKTKRLWHEVIEPNIAGYEHVGEIEWGISSSNGTTAIARSPVRAANGDNGSFGLNVFETPEGGKFSMHDILLASWYLKHRPGSPGVPNTMASRIAGIRADRAKLEELGIMGVYPLHDPRRFYTWSELESFYLSVMIEKERVRAVENVTGPPQS